MHFAHCFTLALLTVCGAAVPRYASQGHEWHRRWLAPRDGEIKLHIAVRQHDSGAAIERQLLLASNPNSPAFRQHLAAEHATTLSPPGSDSIMHIERWLKEHGLLKDAALFGGIYEVDTTIRHAEKLLNTTYFTYTDGFQDVIRTEMYHLPETLNGHVDFVSPTTMFPVTAVPDKLHEHPNDVKKLDPREECGVGARSTPTCIKQIYNINFSGFNYTPQPDRTTFAVYATEGASYDHNELQWFLAKHNQPAAQARPSYQIIGHGDPSNKGGLAPHVEVALDTQTLMGLAWPLKGVLYNEGGVFGPKHIRGKTYDNFVAFLQGLISSPSPPSVVSISESMVESKMDPAYAMRLCNMMAQVGTRGVTLVFSSGNNGAQGDQPDEGGRRKDFEPKFPASCPWVLAVGGTTDLADEKAVTMETVPVSISGLIASGGGFSNLFERPKYQNAAVPKYIAQHIPQEYYSKSGFSAKGRGIPDVAAFATGFPVFASIFEISVDGTSAAAPTWAAVIALLNDYERFHGRPSLGFVDPWLYSLESGLKDITKGGNNRGDCWLIKGCKQLSTNGYDTTEGWDPVTGLGSPVFTDLLRALEDRASSAQ